MELPFFPNGLLPAANSNHYNFIWVRDNYMIGLCSPPSVRQQIWQGLVWLLEKHRPKLEWHTKHPPHQCWEYIHIKYNPDGTEMRCGWDHRQYDSYGNWLQVMVEMERADLAALLVDYLLTIRFWETNCTGIWEDSYDIDANSIASCVSALKNCVRLLPEKSTQLEYMIENGLSSLNALLPKAMRKRHLCLSLLGVIWPYDLAGKHREQMLDLICSKLKREPFGFIRYENDTFDGIGFSRGVGREMPWILGDAWFSRIEPDNSYWRNRLEDARKHFGTLPEGYFPETLQPNINSCLLWTEAMSSRPALESQN
jgi:GH15 family glucan-1,4-alpha-glucosidase